MNWDFEQGVYYQCSDTIINIQRGIHELRFNPEDYKHLEAENGWGTVEGALEDLISLRDCIFLKSKEIPLEYLYMSW